MVVHFFILLSKTLCTCREKIVVPKGKVLTFQGIGNPVLAYDDTANSAGSTQNSASTAILADDFIATGVVFQVYITQFLMIANSLLYIVQNTIVHFKGFGSL